MPGSGPLDSIAQDKPLPKGEHKLQLYSMGTPPLDQTGICGIVFVKGGVALAKLGEQQGFVA